MSKASDLANLIGNINAGGGGVNRNAIINGAMNVAQRGTSSTGLGASSGYFVCDRWYLYSNDNQGRLTMSQDSSVPTGKGFANSLKLQCTTADTSIGTNEGLQITQKIESQNLQSFGKGTSEAKPFAVSFYVKGNASATYVCELMDVDNSNRHIGKTFNVTTDWTRVELTFPADTTGTFDDDSNHGLSLNIFLHSGSFNTSGTLQQTWGTLSQGDRAAGISSFFDSTDRTFFITGVQLEVGQNPTEFEHEPFERTLAKCQRYFYEVGFPDDHEAQANLTMGYYLNSARVDCVFHLPVTMRAAPSIAQSSGTNYFNAYMNGNDQFDAWTGINNGTAQNFVVYVASGVSGTAGDAVLITKNDNSASLSADAEL